MQSLFRNIRFYVLLTSAILASGIYIWIALTVPDSGAQVIKRTQTYALIAITYLYIALLATPLTRAFKRLPFRGQYIKARRAIGVSACFFALMHARSAFFDLLGGLGGLPFLTGKYLFAISLSFTALVILTFMALTSFDFMVAKLSYKRWKFLHRFVYVAGISILIHALMLGTHFQDLSGIIPKVFFIALAVLLILESVRFYRYLQSKLGNSSQKPV